MLETEGHKARKKHTKRESEPTNPKLREITGKTRSKAPKAPIFIGTAMVMPASLAEVGNTSSARNHASVVGNTSIDSPWKKRTRAQGEG